MLVEDLILLHSLVLMNKNVSEISVLVEVVKYFITVRSESCALETVYVLGNAACLNAKLLAALVVKLVETLNKLLINLFAHFFSSHLS